MDDAPTENSTQNAQVENSTQNAHAENSTQNAPVDNSTQNPRLLEIANYESTFDHYGLF